MFASVSLAFSDMSSQKLLGLRSQRSLPVFPSRILMASCLGFWSFIHFEFNSVYAVRKWPKFILLHVTVQFSQHHLYSFPLTWVSVFVPGPYCLDDYSFVIQLEVRDYDASTLVFVFKIALAMWGLFWFHTNCRIVYSSSVKNAGVILTGTAK